MTVQDAKTGSILAPKVYKSPQRKLVWFFEQSRDQWKAKCREAKAVVKRLKNRVRWLEHSRDRWKRQAQALEAELAETSARQPAQEAQVTQEKNPRNRVPRTLTP